MLDVSWDIAMSITEGTLEATSFNVNRTALRCFPARDQSIARQLGAN